MTNEDILSKVLETKGAEDCIMVLGFGVAYMGLTANTPIKVVYDYYKCLDNLIHEGGYDFDDAIDYLEDLINEDLGENAPIYIKQI